MPTKTKPAPAPDETGAHPSYENAAARAKAKAGHGAAPGVLELPDKGAWYYSDPVRSSWNRTPVQNGKCAGQLRTAYVRLSVGGSGGAYGGAGKPTWTPVGVLCDACRAFWKAGGELPV